MLQHLFFLTQKSIISPNLKCFYIDGYIRIITVLFQKSRKLLNILKYILKLSIMYIFENIVKYIIFNKYIFKR